MKFKIRNATPADNETIASFNSLMAEETEGHPLDPSIIGPGVVDILSDPNKGRYWVAESESYVIAQIMVTYEWSDWRNGMLWWIQSVYVHPDFRRHGVFSSLYKHVEAVAQENSAIGLRLYVEQNNVRAQKTYSALGMIDPNYRVMESIFGDTKC